ncbi:nitrogen regulation protein NR(II), partial [Bdellovibrionota bacterium]
QQLDKLKIDTLYPISSENQLLGFCGFSSLERIPNHQLILFQTVINQAAITLKNLEEYEQLRQRDRLAVLGEMAAGLAHEIRNPLGAIKGAAQYLLPPDNELSVPEEEQKEMLRVIVEEADRLNQVVSQFLGFARPYEQNRQEVSLNKVVSKTIDVITKDVPERISISTEFSTKLPTIEIDPEQIRQVILNLLLNAVQSIENDGKVTLQTSMNNGSQSILIRDTGRGIPKENIKKLFIPFFTTREGGTGLGLPICQRIIHAHSGTIQIQSSTEEGTSVSILLPCTSKEITQ